MSPQSCVAVISCKGVDQARDEVNIQRFVEEGFLIVDKQKKFLTEEEAESFAYYPDRAYVKEFIK